jgi:hypothetical protein
MSCGRIRSTPTLPRFLGLANIDGDEVIRPEAVTGAAVTGRQRDDRARGREPARWCGCASRSTTGGASTQQSRRSRTPSRVDRVDVTIDPEGIVRLR